jgi:hypothetical protein
MTEDNAGRGRRFLQQAQSYAGAAAALAAGGVGPRVRPPYFMLVAHSTELALKAVIADGDADDEQLMLLGHDLPLCLRWAIDRGLDLDPVRERIEAVINDLAMPHLAQTLRYPALLAWPLPDPAVALEALTKLLAQVESALAAPGLRPAAV